MKPRSATSRGSGTTAAWIALCLMSLSACSTPAVRNAEPVPPPASLEPRPLPRFEGVTYRDLADYALRLRESAAASEADKAAAAEQMRPTAQTSNEQ